MTVNDFSDKFSSCLKNWSKNGTNGFSCPKISILGWQKHPLDHFDGWLFIYLINININHKPLLRAFCLDIKALYASVCWYSSNSFMYLSLSFSASSKYSYKMTTIHCMNSMRERAISREGNARVGKGQNRMQFTKFCLCNLLYSDLIGTYLTTQSDFWGVIKYQTKF